MLVLSRKEGEKLLIMVPGIAEPLVIKLMRAHDGKSRMAFDGPKDFHIVRKEVYDDDRQEQPSV